MFGIRLGFWSRSSVVFSIYGLTIWSFQPTKLLWPLETLWRFQGIPIFCFSIMVLVREIRLVRLRVTVFLFVLALLQLFWFLENQL